MIRWACVLAALAAVAAARPPRSPHFARTDDLLPRVEALIEKLEEAEAFVRKPRVERLLVRFGEGDERFEGRRLTGGYAVREVLDWPDVQRAEPSPAAVRALALLPDVLKRRFALVMPIPKAARYDASVPLVSALTARHLHVRAAAIASLDALYGTVLSYHPEMPPSAREAKQKEWKRKIRELRRE